MALNIVQRLDKEQLIKVVRESGYKDIANVLSKQNINGQIFLQIHENHIANWECSYYTKKKMIKFLKQFKDNPSILQLSSTSAIHVPPTEKSIILETPTYNNRKISQPSKSRKINERRSSLPTKEIDDPMDNRMLLLPTNHNTRKNKSLNDLNQESANPHIIGNQRAKMLSQTFDRNLQLNPTKTNTYRLFQQIPHPIKHITSIPKIDIQELGSSSEFSSDDDNIGTYVNIRRTSSMNNEVEPENIYENLETLHLSSFQKKKKTITSAVNEELTLTFKERCELLEKTKQVRKPFGAISTSEEKSSHYDYPPVRNSNIVKPISMTKVNMETEKSPISTELVHNNVLVNNEGYSDHPIYENLQDILAREKKSGNEIKHTNQVSAGAKNLSEKNYGSAYAQPLFSTLLMEELATKHTGILKLNKSNNNDTKNDGIQFKSKNIIDNTSVSDNNKTEASSPIYSNKNECFQYHNPQLLDEDVDNQYDAVYGNVQVLEQSTRDLNPEHFFRNTDRKGAQQILQPLPDGAFLFRPSHRFFLALSIKFKDRIYNMGIIKTPNKKLRLDGVFSTEFDSLAAFFKYYMRNKISFMYQNKWLEISLNPSFTPTLS